MSKETKSSKCQIFSQKFNNLQFFSDIKENKNIRWESNSLQYVHFQVVYKGLTQNLWEELNGQTMYSLCNISSKMHIFNIHGNTQWNKVITWKLLEELDSKIIYFLYNILSKLIKFNNL